MSTKTAHTPGPWEVSSSLYVVSPLGRVVAKCDGMRVADLDAPAPQMFANAARIVACVNACEGVPTDALNAAARTEYTATPIALAAVITERDSLRERNAALEEVALLLDQAFGLADSKADLIAKLEFARSKARAALKEARS